MNDVQTKPAPATLPGPKAKALIERDAKVVSPSYVRDYPFVVSHGKGAELWDVDGNRFVDFMSGIAVCSTGHAHPTVVAAIQKGMAANANTHFTFGHYESLIIHFHKQLKAALLAA